MVILMVILMYNEHECSCMLYMCELGLQRLVDVFDYIDDKNPPTRNLSVDASCNPAI